MPHASALPHVALPLPLRAPPHLLPRHPSLLACARPCSKKKRRGRLSDAEGKAMVENVLATMEAAAEEDLKQYEQGGALRVCVCLWVDGWGKQRQAGGFGACAPGCSSAAAWRLLLGAAKCASTRVAGAPAVFKLKVLSKVEDVLSTKLLHSELLDAGLLGGACRGGGVTVLLWQQLQPPCCCRRRAFVCRGARAWRSCPWPSVARSGPSGSLRCLR